MNAYTILDIARNKELEGLGQAYSDYGEQIKTRYNLDGMEGGFGSSETFKLGKEYTKAQADIMKNYDLKRRILKEKERMAEEARKKKKLGGMLVGGGKLIKGASMFLGPAGALAGSIVGQGLQAGGSYVLDEPIDIDWEDIYSRWNKWR